MKTIMTLFALSMFAFFGSVLSHADDSTAKFTEAGHTVDTLGTVKKRITAKEAVLIDVRERDEWDAGHLKQAKLVPMSVVKADQLTEKMKKSLPKDKPIYCHCRSGNRVLKVSKLLRAQGYDVRPLKAGYADLVKAGFEGAIKKANP